MPVAPHRPRRRAAWAGVAALLLTLLTAASADAALTFERSGCGESNYACARLTVPLDRTGKVPGSVRLYVEHTRDEPTQGAVFALAGGPGQGASTLTENFGADLYGVVGDRDVIVMDQRGTGNSGALNCPSLENPPDARLDVHTTACAAQLGPARAFYTTRDSVADLEVVRAALGIPRITLFGISYGTKVALAYAAAHPDHVERLVLDSVVPPEGQSPFDLDSFAALPRVLDEICRGECRGITPSLSRDVATLAARLRTAPLRGPIVDSRGRRTTATVTGRDLYERIRAGDLLADVRVEYPGAVRAALAGDPAPLVRVEHRYDDIATPDPDPEVAKLAVRSLSSSLQAATLCEEAPLPWARTASPAERDAQTRTAAAAVPAAAFAPFDREVALVRDANSLLLQCRGWPAAPDAPTTTGPLPDVPVLIFEGLEDTRTPLDVGRRIATRFPRAELVAATKTGHAVVGQRRGSAGCARTALRRFFAGRPVGNPCSTVRRTLRVLPVPPARLAAVPPARGTSGRVGRTLAAVLLTLRDLESAERTTFFEPRQGGGLRAGRWTARGNRLDVRGFSFVPGVTVSGRLTAATRLTGTVAVRGAQAARGTLTLGRDRILRGRLDGRAVRARYVPPPTG